MTKPYRLAVVIGRFQPVHSGHLALFQRASQLADEVVVVVGSAERPRNVRNPFTAAERRVMVNAAWKSAGLDARLQVVGLRDAMYNDQRWAGAVQTAVLQASEAQGSSAGPVALVGHEKDATTAYLRMFPQWSFEAVANVDGLSATDLRNYYLDDSIPESPSLGSPTVSLTRDRSQTLAQGRQMMIEASVPRSTLEFLSGFRESPHFSVLQEEYRFLKAYRRQFEGLKYPPIFVTVDAVTVQSGHVLLVQRDQNPGAGLWALPGGFIDPNETLIDACLRELREETRLKVPVPVLRGSVHASRAFDHPQRSLRGRTITHAFLITLADGPLPPIKGGSDARGARWVPVSKLAGMSEQLFEDHFDILEHFLGQI